MLYACHQFVLAQPVATGGGVISSTHKLSHCPPLLKNIKNIRKTLRYLCILLLITFSSVIEQIKKVFFDRIVVSISNIPGHDDTDVATCHDDSCQID